MNTTPLNNKPAANGRKWTRASIAAAVAAGALTTEAANLLYAQLKEEPEPDPIPEPTPEPTPDPVPEPAWGWRILCFALIIKLLILLFLWCTRYAHDSVSMFFGIFHPIVQI